MGLISTVAERIAASQTRLEPHHVRAEAARILSTESPLWDEADVDDVVARLLGLGVLDEFQRDPEVTDILVNGPNEVWIDRGEGLVKTGARFKDDEDIVNTVERAIAPLGVRFDRSAPMVDARLADGSRLHAVLPPASVEGPLVAIRRFVQRVSRFGDLVAAGTLSSGHAEILRTAVAERKTIVISGGTGAGKTTLLRLLASLISEEERIVTIEDAAELDLPGHVVRLEARPANTEGVGEIALTELLRSSLRLRPDRIVVGEVRGPEALDLINALNTGHRGAMTTVHANSPTEAMWRLETLALSAGHPSREAIVAQLEAAVDLVVQIERRGTERCVTSVEAVHE